MATLNKQVWIRQILEGFYPDSSFLKYPKDLSSLVDNDCINLAEAGVDPEVLVNNTTYPIAVHQRIDKAIQIELDRFETENSIVRNPEVIEYAYDQLESVIRGHRATMMARTAEKAAHAYAPQKDTLCTPVIKTTGAEAEGKRSRLSYKDIIELKSRFDSAEIPLENRVLVLAPSHATDLLLEDIKLFKNLTDLKSGTPFNFAGFSILQFSRPPQYTLKDDKLEKVAFDETVANSRFASFAFQADEVMKADGQLYMYKREDDPEQRGTILGFDKRFIAFTFRDKGVGAIVSNSGL